LPINHAGLAPVIPSGGVALRGGRIQTKYYHQPQALMQHAVSRQLQHVRGTRVDPLLAG